MDRKNLDKVAALKSLDGGTAWLLGRVLRRLKALRRVIDHPVVMDVGVVLVALLLARAQDINDLHANLISRTGAFDLALVLPLLWRRRQPGVVFAAIAAVALIQWLSHTQAGGDFAVLVALYALGGYERRRRLIAAGVLIAQIGVVLAVLRWAPPGNELTAGILLTGTVTAAWVMGVYSRTRRAYLNSILERAATAERERDQQALLAVTSERARISREMHDIVAHSLSVMIALNDGAAAAITRNPQAARTTLGQSSTLGRQALGEIRRLLGDEHSPGAIEPHDLAPQPGIAQLDDLVAQVRAAGLMVDLIVAGHPPELPPGAQLAVYRMIQEALTNVLKHAPAATHATVTVDYRSGGIDIEVENDDEPPRPGPAHSNPVTTAGRGLTGMRERAAVFGGTITYGRSDDGSWRVVAHLPLNKQVPTP